MATTVSFNNLSYSIPAVGNRNWGVGVTNFLIAVAGNALSKSGGNFTLTADTNFGANYGLIAKYLKSISSNIAQSGVVRLANNEGIAWRNAANGADKTLKVDASDKLAFGASAVSEAELGYLSGVTSGVQSQLDGKEASLAAGTSAQYYRGDKSWQDLATAVAATAAVAANTAKTFDSLAPTTTKGDLPVHDGTNNVRLPVGSDGQVLTADAAETTGLKWTSPLTNPMTTEGAIIVGGASGAATSLTIGSTDQLLTVVSGTPTWRTGIKGVTDASNAAAGYVGEYKELTVTSARNFGTSNQYFDFTDGTTSSLSLGAGDWDVWFMLYATEGATSVLTSFGVGISTTTGNSGTGLTFGDSYVEDNTHTNANSLRQGLMVFKRFNVSSSTTVYGKVIGTWTTAAPTYVGKFWARRVR